MQERQRLARLSWDGDGRMRQRFVWSDGWRSRGILIKLRLLQRAACAKVPKSSCTGIMPLVFGAFGMLAPGISSLGLHTLEAHVTPERWGLSDAGTMQTSERGKASV